MTESKPQFGVFYVDGSCRPHNPGFIGWGVHGFIYEENVEKPIYVDNFVHTSHGYQKGTDPLPGTAQYIKPIGYVDGFGSDRELLTNNVAEIKGLYNLLIFLEKEKLESVRVFTDSEYMKTCMNEWCKRWERNDWKKQDGQPVSNREIIEKTYNLLKAVRAKGTQVSIAWIRAHTGHLGNERADVLAGIGMNHSQNRVFVDAVEKYDVKGYWKNDVERNPYIAFRRLYFNSVKEHHQPAVYHLAESPDTDFIIGKPAASTGYSVIYLNQPDPILEMIKEQQFDNSRGINVILLMKLDSVYSKYVYPWLQKYGKMAMVGNRGNHSLSLVDKKPVTVEMNPTGLSMRSLDHFALLEETLLESLKQEGSFTIGAVPITPYDITDRFYKTVVDKKGAAKHELHKELEPGQRDVPLTIDFNYNDAVLKVKIPYLMGFDCLPRNNLKHLEGSNPKITLLVWVEGSVLKYATTITSDYGTGIWSNYFANQVLLPTKK